MKFESFVGAHIAKEIPVLGGSSLDRRFYSSSFFFKNKIK
jgi:hypothetical protein